MSELQRVDGLPIGGVLANRYEITKHLGVGGFGETYLAKDRERFGARCVVKRLRPDRQSNEIALRLFEREARALADLQHPRIPKLLAYFDRDGEFFLVQDFVEGETLEDRLARESRLEEGFVRDVVLQVLEVLDYLQRREPPVIHRDIKPSNLIIDKNGQVHLIDFGAMREAVAVRPSEVGTSIGTSGFTPAEQIFGKPVPASDLYALAATALNLLSGQSPHDWLNGLELDWRNRMPYSRGFAEYLDGSLADLPRRLKTPTAARTALLGSGEMSQPTVASDAPPARARRATPGADAPTVVDPPQGRASNERRVEPERPVSAQPSAPAPPPARFSRPLVWAAVGVLVAGGLAAAAMMQRDSSNGGSKAPATSTSNAPLNAVAAVGDTCGERTLKSFRTESQFDLRILCPKDWTSFRSAEQSATRIMAPDGTQIWASVWTPASSNETLEAFARRWQNEMQVALGTFEMMPNSAASDEKTLNYKIVGRRFAASPPGSVQIERSTAGGNRYFTWSLVIGVTPLSKPTAQEVLTSIEFLSPDAAQQAGTPK